MCVHPGDPGKSVLSVEMLPGSGPWRCFGVLCCLVRQLILLFTACPHLGSTLGWASPSLPTGSPVTFSAGPSLTVGGETES